MDKIQAVNPPRRLTEEIANQIEQLIIGNELEVGDGLPAERELAAKLNVSRNILREAISMLAQKGLLEVRPGAGTFVRRPSSEFLRDTLTFFIRFSPSALLDLVQARRCIEAEIARLAAHRATSEQVAELLANTREMEKNRKHVGKYVDADVRFHEILAEAAGNQILQLLLSSIRGALRENMRMVLKNAPAVTSKSIRHHRAIAEALRAGDAESARDAMLKHLDEIVKQLTKLDNRRA